VRVEIRIHQARLRAPLVSSRDALDLRPLIVLTLRTADGHTGHGEAAPLAGYHGSGVDDVLAALRACEPALARAGSMDQDALRARCAELTAVPQALAAIDLALWDLAGRRAGVPVWRLLGASSSPAVALNATIGALDSSGAAREAAAAVSAGFGAIKVKVGVGDDAGRLAATRAAAGRDTAIRIDANGAWSVAQALAALRALEPVRIECCEEPVHGVPAIAQVASASAVPVSLDESATDAGALERRACAAVCLKIARCGGITGVLRDAAHARRAGYEVYLASTFDGPLGIAAALHAAATVGPDRACGLATLALFEGEDPLPPRAGTLAPPSGPGLGGPWLDWYGAPVSLR
jgi:L-alanine-DL-glutamate epimerase-like enolase superfamily enzyme